MNITVILPSWNRPNRLQQSLEALRRNTHDVTIAVALHAGDVESLNVAKSLADSIFVHPNRSFIPFWCRYDPVVQYIPSDWYVIWADDVVAEPGWLEAALSSPEKGMVGMWDGWAVTHFVISHKYLMEHLHGHVPPYYWVWCVDNELIAVANGCGEYKVVSNPICRQYHPCHNNAPDDDTYRLGDKHHREDYQLFLDRSARGVPDEPSRYNWTGYWDASQCEVRQNDVPKEVKIG